MPGTGLGVLSALRRLEGRTLTGMEGGREGGSITHFQIYPKDMIQPTAQKIQIRIEQVLLYGECGMLDA